MLNPRVSLRYVAIIPDRVRRHNRPLVHSRYRYHNQDFIWTGKPVRRTRFSSAVSLS